MSEAETKPECYTYEGQHYLRDRHEPECGGDCSGCSLCPEPHCTARRNCREHVDHGQLTCPKCIGRTREDLAEIERMYSLLPDEAVIEGVDSEAAMLAGPAIDTAEDMEAEKHRQMSIAVGRISGDVEPHGQHPVTVLGWWDIAFREDYDQPTGLRITVSRSVAYLSSMLGIIAQDPEQDWPVFAREVRACRSHLEAVLHDGEQVEKGAPCPTCRDEREDGDPEPPALVLQRQDKDTSGAKDRWVCRRDRNHRWSVAEYRLRVGSDHVTYADRLTMRDLPQRTRIPLSTLRKWAARQYLGNVDGEAVYGPPLLKACGKSEDGRKLYRVDDALTLRDRSA